MTDNIFRVALTGGIASGKTTVANMFEQLGACVIDTDVIARDVVAPGTPTIKRLVDMFGAAIVQTDGKLDRRALRQIVFADEKKRLQLESILHPLIQAETERQMQSSIGDYQVIVVPLLLGSPLKDRVERILVVDCSEETQLRRLLERDLETSEQAQRMIEAQPSRENRLALADDVILNDADLCALDQQVARRHQQYLALAADPER